MRTLQIVHCESVEVADEKGYNRENKYKKATPLILKEAVIVENGTKFGKATVDLILYDLDDNMYVAMVTKELLKTGICAT